MTALEEYEKWSDDTKDWTPTEGRKLAEAAIESLKCCGNCDHSLRPLHIGGAGFICDQPYDGAQLHPGPDNHCHFTPSRWKERSCSS